MSNSISVVINTLNEAENISRAILSVKWADEILICDMHSTDRTVEIAKKLGAKVIFSEKVEYVEPARNFAISKAKNEWILILDPDEEIPESLGIRLQEIAEGMKQIDYVKIARKNFIFNHWMKASMWWPDLNIRMFRSGKVKWGNRIHRPPEVSGLGIDLEADEKFAIKHNHYMSITEFLEKMIRYTKIQSEELVEDGYKFNWKDLIIKPLSEFLSRFFANKGYEDGVHGLVLSFLQAFSFLIVYIRVWEKEGFKSKEVSLADLKNLNKKSAEEINYWFKYSNLSKNVFKRFAQKIKNKI